MNYFNETAPETNLGDSDYIFADETYNLLTFTVGSIGVLGFCNNIIVIILYFRFKRLRTPTNLLIMNISVSDLLVSITGVNFTFVSCVKRRWIFNSATCVWDGFSNSLFGQSVFSRHGSIVTYVSKQSLNLKKVIYRLHVLFPTNVSLDQERQFRHLSGMCLSLNSVWSLQSVRLLYSILLIYNLKTF